MVPGLMWKKRIGKKDMQEQKTDDPNPEPEVQEDPDPELRSKWVNPLYHEVDELRGNSASLLVRYMNLRQRGCVARYLTHFPEHGTWFGQWSEKTHKLARRVYFVYRNCFIFKTTTLADASREQPWLSSVLNSLHYHYRTQLKPAGKVVTQSQVIQWLQSQPAERMAAWVSCI